MWTYKFDPEAGIAGGDIYSIQRDDYEMFWLEIADFETDAEALQMAKQICARMNG